MKRPPRALLPALALALTLPATAAAYVTLGPTNANPDPSNAQALNWPSASLLFTAAAPVGVQLSAPAGGVVVRWRLFTDRVGPDTSVQLRLLVPVAGDDYQVTRSGHAIPVAPADPTGAQDRNLLHIFEGGNPIEAGELVGVQLTRPSSGGFVMPMLPVGTGWAYRCMGPACAGSAPPPPDGGTAPTSPINGQFVALNADIEPDTDGDRFGDDSQDRCTDQAGTDRGCPPGALDPQVVREVVTERETVVQVVQPGNALAIIDPTAVRFTRGRRQLSVPLRCPDQARSRCVGRISAKTVRVPIGKRRRSLSLGSARYSVGRNSTRRIAISVPRRSRTALGRLRTVRVVVALTESAEVQRTLG